MFIMQSFHCSFCFNEIRSLIQWSFEYILYSTFVILNNLLLSPPNLGERLAVLVIFVPSFQNVFLLTMFGWASFLQHLLDCAVHSLPFGSSMFGTMSEVLFDDVTGN